MNKCMKKNDTWKTYILQKDIIKKVFMVMKITVFILLFTISSAFAKSTYSQNTRMSLHMENATIQQIFDEIRQHSEFIIFYRDDQVNLNYQSNIDAENATVDQILDQALKGTDLGYRIIDRQIVISSDKMKELPSLEKSETTAEQKKEISGTVKDTNGLPLPGVSVVVKGTTIGIITNANGQFSLSIPEDAKILVLSFIGMKTQEITITGKTSLTVVLEEQTFGLGEVVAVGYGTMKKITMTGAVSKLKGESLLTSPLTDVTNSLQGKVTGVTSIQQNGQPGLQTADIFVRGRATFGDATAIVIVDGVERTNFGTIDPNEIESMTVLKDASATAIFGIRGANGVIVVTTKKGKEGKPIISYSGNVAANFYNYPQPLDAYNTAILQNVGAHNNGKSTGWNFYWTDAELEHFRKQDLPYQYPDVNWMNTISRKYNTQTQHNLSVQGGTKSVKYYISAGYMYAGGILKELPSTLGIKTTDSYSKYNFRSNLDFDVTRDLRISVNLAGTMENIYQPFPNYSLNQVFYRALNLPSNRSPVYAPDGSYAVGMYSPSAVGNNPVADITQTGYMDGQKNKIESNLNIDLKMNWLTKGLSFKTMLSYDNSMNSYVQQTAGYAAYVVDRFTGNITKSPTYQDYTALSAITPNNLFGARGGLSYSLQTGFDYAREFGKHSVSGMIRFTRQLTEANILADAPFVYQGVVSRLTYNYNNKYLLEGSIAANGSENFPKGKRYGIFPSVSAGYILSNEDFFKNVKFINLLKIRGSLGLVGNDKFPGGTARYLYLDAYSVSAATTNWSKSTATTPGSAYYFGQPSAPAKYNVIMHSRIGNPDITWETGLKGDIGIETAFFKDKIKMTADYFHEKRSNILMDPRSGLEAYGEAYPKLSKGAVENKGYEVELDMNNKFGEFTLGLTVSISHIANKVIDADDPPGIPDYQKLAGKRVGQYFGFTTAGFFNSQQEVDDSNNQVAGAWPKNTMAIVVPGDLKFVDYNHDGIISSLDKHPILTSNLPEYNYSFTPSVSYKNFSLLVMFQGTMKSMSDYLMTYNMFPFMKDSWTPTNVAAGKKIIWPALRDGWSGPSIDPPYANDFVIKRNDYLKLRNLMLSYQVPVTFTKSLHMSSVRLYISGQNLATWSSFKDFFHIDPEVYIGSTGGANPTKREYAYPLSSTINFGVSVQF